MKLKLSKLDIELLLESISYNQLHIQKLYELAKNDYVKEIYEMKHNRLASISHQLIKEFDNYDD